MARVFCTAALVMYITKSAAMAGCFEYLDTPNCQPPSAAALGLPGNLATPTLPLTRLSFFCSKDHA